MQQLSGLDSLFSYNESPSTPMHIGSLSVYAVPQGASVPSIDDIQAIVEGGLDNSPIFRRKLVKLPRNLDRPYWAEQREIELSHHVRQASLENANSQSLNELIADIHAQPLDSERPLWEIWLIHGLEQGPQHFALYMKVHHSVLDGISAAEVFASLHTREPGYDSELARQAQGKSRGWKNPFAWSLPERTRVQWAHFANANRRLKKMRDFGQLNTVVREKRKDLAESPGNKVMDLNWERSRFNNRISEQRTIEVVDLPLAELRKMRRTMPGSTVNHVLLAIIGGGLREYLLSKQDLPETALSSVVPMNVRQRGKEATGNVLSILLANLHTDIADPQQRLLAVRDSATRGREQSLNLGKNTVQLIADILPSRTAAFGLKAISALSMLPGETRLPFNTIVSSLALPPVPLYFAGAELQQLSCYGLLANHMGLFHTAVTYQQTLSLSVLACKKIMPDAGYYGECLQSSFDDLSAACA